MRGKQLKAAFDELKGAAPGLYPRDAARSLQTTELELQLALSPQNRLVAMTLEQVGAILAELPDVKLVLRSDGLVLEVSGQWVFSGGVFETTIGRCSIQPAFVAMIAGAGRLRPSLQFYDQNGTALAKFFHDDLLLSAENWPDQDQPTPSFQERTLLTANPTERPAQLISAVASSGHLFACTLELERASMQVRTQIERAMPARGWFNILDPHFDLHLQPDLIHECTEKEGSGGQSLQIRFVDGSLCTMEAVVT